MVKDWARVAFLQPDRVGLKSNPGCLHRLEERSWFTGPNLKGLKGALSQDDVVLRDQSFGRTAEGEST